MYQQQPPQWQPPRPRPKKPVPRWVWYIAGGWVAVFVVAVIVVRVSDPKAFQEPTVADPSASASVSDSPTPSVPVAAPTGAQMPHTISDGTWQVPAEVKPGLYRTEGPQDGEPPCYWARLSGLGGTTDEIIANGAPAGPTTVRVSEGDKGFETRGCLLWKKIG